MCRCAVPVVTSRRFTFSMKTEMFNLYWGCSDVVQDGCRGVLSHK